MLLASTKSHTSNFCRCFSPKSVSDHLVHSTFSAGTFLSDLHPQTQNTFKRPGDNILGKLIRIMNYYDEIDGPH